MLLPCSLLADHLASDNSLEGPNPVSLFQQHAVANNQYIGVWWLLEAVMCSTWYEPVPFSVGMGMELWNVTKTEPRLEYSNQVCSMTWVPKLSQITYNVMYYVCIYITCIQSYYTASLARDSEWGVVCLYVSEDPLPSLCPVLYQYHIKTFPFSVGPCHEPARWEGTCNTNLHV